MYELYDDWDYMTGKKITNRSETFHSDFGILNGRIFFMSREASLVLIHDVNWNQHEIFNSPPSDEYVFMMTAYDDVVISRKYIQLSNFYSDGYGFNRNEINTIKLLL